MSETTTNIIAFKITFIYILFGIVWILFTDQLVVLLFPDPEIQNQIQHIKGVFYVVLTALLLFWMIWRSLRQRARIQEKAITLERKVSEIQTFETVGLISSQIAHDLRNQIMVIENLYRLNEKENEGMSGEKQEKDDFERAVRQTYDLLQQMMQFGKKHPVSVMELDLNQFIKAQSSMYRAFLGNEIQLTLNLPSTLPKIRASSTEWMQILLNLILNAKDAIYLRLQRYNKDNNNKEIQLENRFTPKISIKTTLMSKKEENNPIDLALPPQIPKLATGYVMCEISDNGIGILPESLPNLFSPYFTTKGESTGTGLGLYTITKILEKNKGQIRVFSRRNEITTFQIIWPVLPR